MKFSVGAVLLGVLLVAGAQAAPSCDPDKAPASRYSATAGEVLDRDKNITWARCVVGETWIDGSGCVGERKVPEASQLAGVIPPGWRLPNSGEILTLGSICESSGANREIFKNISIEIGLGFWVSDRAMNNGGPVAVIPKPDQIYINVAQKNAFVRLVKDTGEMPRQTQPKVIAPSKAASPAPTPAPPVLTGDPFEDGIAAVKRRDWATVLRLLLPFAERGNAKAQLYVAEAYYSGDVVINGSRLGSSGVDRDYGEAAKWFKRAADQGDAEGQAYLAGMYHAGLGLPADKLEALRLYNLAAAQGSFNGLFNLGNMYACCGDDVDYVQAYKWFRLAANAASAPSPARKAADDRITQLTLKMRPEQVSEGERLAREWKR